MRETLGENLYILTECLNKFSRWSLDLHIQFCSHGLDSSSLEHVQNAEGLRLYDSKKLGLGRVLKNSPEYPHTDNQPEFE